MIHAIGSKFSTEGNRLTTLIESHATEIPTKNVINFQLGERHALSDISMQSRAYGAGLSTLKYGNKDSILLVLPNTVERLYLQLAASYAGCQVATVDTLDDVDIFNCLKTSKARGLFVAPSLVPKVRAAVPELTLAGSTKEKNPRFFKGFTTEMKPIGALDFPHLKQVFQTGTEREHRFHMLKHLPLYFPVPNPLASAKPAAEADPYFTVLSAKGEVIKSASRESLLSQADKVVTSLGLKPDESLFLSTKGDAHTSMVGFLACLTTWAQLVVPNQKDHAKWEAFAKSENVVAAIGDVDVPKAAGSRVARL